MIFLRIPLAFAALDVLPFTFAIYFNNAFLDKRSVLRNFNKRWALFKPHFSQDNSVR